MVYLLLAWSLPAVYAADTPRNILGIRAGYNHSWVTSYGLGTSAKEGFSAGIVDNIRLSARVPFYFQTGVYFNNIGYAIKGYDDSNTTLNYISVPVAVNYRIAIGRDVTIVPQAGLYYSAGVWGRLHKDSADIDVFKDDCISRHDFGFNLGAGFTVKNIYLGAAYSQGFIDIDRKNIVYDGKPGMLGYSKLKNRYVAIHIGYNFNF